MGYRVSGCTRISLESIRSESRWWCLHGENISCSKKEWQIVNARLGTNFAVCIALKVFPKQDFIFQEKRRLFRRSPPPLERLAPLCVGDDLCPRESVLVRKWNLSTSPPGFLSGPQLNPKLCALFHRRCVERSYFWRQDNGRKEIKQINHEFLKKSKLGSRDSNGFYPRSGI